VCGHTAYLQIKHKGGGVVLDDVVHLVRWVTSSRTTAPPPVRLIWSRFLTSYLVSKQYRNRTCCMSTGPCMLHTMLECTPGGLSHSSSCRLASTWLPPPPHVCFCRSHLHWVDEVWQVLGPGCSSQHNTCSTKWSVTGRAERDSTWNQLRVWFAFTPYRHAPQTGPDILSRQLSKHKQCST
jgi:hypothetical protein